MAFQKGISGNPSGRPPGANNKINGRIRELLSAFVEENFDDVQNAFKSLEGKEKVKAYTELLPYVVPRLQATSLDVDIEKLSDEDLDQLYHKIIDTANK